MTTGRTHGGRAFAICFLAGMCEGYDMLVAGVAAPRFAPVLGLDSGQVGLVFAAAGVGLLLGATIGGRLADRHGRRAVLVASLVALGVFSIASAFAHGLGFLLGVRFLAGLGLGGALPNLLAIVNETSPATKTTTRVTMLGSAMPLGGALLGVGTVVVPELSWQAMFWIGGLLPLAAAAACQAILPRFTAPGRADGTPGSLRLALVGDGRGSSTALLWTTTLCVAMSVALMVNWLPSLMAARSFNAAATGRIVMLLTLGGAASGFAFGALTERLHARVVHGLAWSGMVASILLILAADHSERAAAAAALGLGFFLSGGQFLLYGLATDLYPQAVRGTGTGFAVGAGRFGAILGPLLAGLLLARSGDADDAFLALIPLILVSWLTVFALSRIHPRRLAGPSRTGAIEV
ncbi:MFS transporter [Sphingomonas aerophila]|jgi:AAHS family 3-hydroxyphenylpropionic acid transporter|uniref:AAHS family 3-hydroxyphenylpropionic acid transporter n=1 Tax=Sphingomonas aerophila TaxID=1344948 RepID=A0A7W9BFF1_9SPHN|nr:MFS transporter [Sphingomonas aerophila]MBB5716265.1 AAHS family 3-hydroxyphenylpropionic acid transporter [Sphingomonas aerophila]